MKKWLVKTPDAGAVDTLARETGFSPFICKILAGRGIFTRDEADAFFNSEELSDPFLMADMEKAVETIREFVESGEKITIYGDYDCDGITSTYILFDYLRALGAEVDWYLPSRDEGYGLNNNAIDLLHRQGTKLIITVDNGISAVEEAKHIAELGMTLVITDHHQVPDVLPEAAAIVNPHRKDDMSIFRKIAGCGVALRLVAAMEEDGESALMEYAPFATIGTVADVMPLTGENRLIVRKGLEALSCTDNLGLYALLRKSGCHEDEEVTSTMVAFRLSPRINAAGRCEHPKIAMELLLAETQSVANAKAEEVHHLNDVRKQAEEEIVKAVEEQIKADPDALNRKVLIVVGEGWKHGIIGIASAKLLHKYNMPNIVITIEGDTARGSARSFDELPLHKMLEACKEHLVRYGGHAKSAGLTIETEKIDDFRKAVFDYCKDREAAVEKIEIDMEIAPEEITVENIELLDRLEPFGEENPSPLFMFRNCTIGTKKSLANGKFVAFSFIYRGKEFRAVNFNSTFDDFTYETGETVDMVASIQLEEYKGNTNIKAFITDVRYSDFNQDRYFAAKNAYEDYRNGKVDKKLICRMVPEQAELRKCYDILRKTKRFSKAVMLSSKENVNYCKFRIILDIFGEFGLIETDFTKDYVSLVPSAPKADLTKSKILSDLKNI